MKPQHEVSPRKYLTGHPPLSKQIRSLAVLPRLFYDNHTEEILNINGNNHCLIVFNILLKTPNLVIEIDVEAVVFYVLSPISNTP
jgi:hypothetical protein